MGVGSVQIDEQFIDLIHDFFRPRILPIDLVDHGNRRQAGFERFSQDEPSLWQAAFGRVNQEHYAIDHLQDPLDLAAEISVTRCIDYIDLVIAVTHRSVLGHDRDAAFAFQVHGIHHAFDDLFVLAKGAGLLEHGIDQRGLAVIDVGDNGDVANLARVHALIQIVRKRPFEANTKNNGGAAKAQRDRNA